MEAAVLSALNTPVKDFVLIGNLTQLPQCSEVFPNMESIYHVRFHIPPYAEYCTAIGAALAYIKIDRHIVGLYFIYLIFIQTNIPVCKYIANILSS